MPLTSAAAHSQSVQEPDAGKSVHGMQRLLSPRRALGASMISGSADSTFLVKVGELKDVLELAEVIRRRERHLAKAACLLAAKHAAAAQGLQRFPVES